MDRNAEIFKEIRESGLKLKIGKLIGRSDGGTTFNSLENYYSRILNKRLYIGLKTNESYYDDNVVRDLALISKVEKEAPHLLSEFPIFHGVLRNDNRNFIGIICEDFSEGGKYLVEGMKKSWREPVKDSEVPKDMEKILGVSIDNHDLVTTCFMINGKRRIGDFGEFFMPVAFSYGRKVKMERVFPSKQILKRLREFTLRINYEL